MEVNYRALDALDFLIRDNDVWVSTISLSEALGVKHANLLRSVERLNDKLENTLTDSPLGKVYNEILIKFKSIPMESKFRSNTITRYYILNSEFTTELLLNYSFEVRVAVQNVFWKAVRNMKEKGHEVNDIKSLNEALDKDIDHKLQTLESDLVDDNEDLDEFNMYHVIYLLLKKIPKPVDEFFKNKFIWYKNLKDHLYENGDMLHVSMKSVYGDDYKNKNNWKL